MWPPRCFSPGLPGTYLLNKVKKQLSQGHLRFNTLLVGGNSIAERIFFDTRDGLRTAGYHYTGFISAGEPNGISRHIPWHGWLRDMEKVIHERNIQLVVIALEKRRKSTR